ncbi:hypothetical protein CPC16_002488, partial [Podila verticillata]
MNPSGGADALNAMHDAVSLANWINTLQSLSLANLKKVFKEYHHERLPVAKKSFKSCQVFTRNLRKMRSKYTAALRLFMRRLPKWLWTRMMAKI